MTPDQTKPTVIDKIAQTSGAIEVAEIELGVQLIVSAAVANELTADALSALKEEAQRHVDGIVLQAQRVTAERSRRPFEPTTKADVLEGVARHRQDLHVPKPSQAVLLAVQALALLAIGWLLGLMDTTPRAVWAVLALSVLYTVTVAIQHKR